ncbi:flagellin [Arcobacter sp. LA11]|uniref:flagellin n=1 Tax=Arcobacter sp. LA11 TaxID=1898176 RepID=UPI00093416FF|nr:flagellin [Arcobacter sp. LA11]
MQVNNNIQLDQSVYLNANQALNRIATGLDINSAADDASGLAIAENLRVQTSGISQSIDNVNSGLASLQIADKAISEQSNILDTVKEKLLQASTDTTSQDGRESLLTEIKDLLENFDNIASSTNYNEQTLLQNTNEDKSISQGLEVQAGEKSEDIIDSEGIQSNTQGVGLEALLNQDPDSFSAEEARGYLENVDNAISTVNDYRGEIGSTQNQLQSSAANLLTQSTQLTAASSIIQDIDYAKETSNFSKQNVLAQIGAYAAAQSNNINQGIVTRLLS